LEGARYIIETHEDGSASQQVHPTYSGKRPLGWVEGAIRDDGKKLADADPDLKEQLDEKRRELKLAAEHVAVRKANAEARAFFANVRASASSSASTSSVAAPVAAASSSSSLSSSSAAPRAAPAARAPAAPLAKPAEDGKEAKPKKRKQPKKSQYPFNDAMVLKRTSELKYFGALRWTADFTSTLSGLMVSDVDVHLEAARRIANARGRQTMDVVDLAEATVVADLVQEAYVPDGETERSDELVSEIARCVSKAKMYAAKRESDIITDADRKVAREILDAVIAVLDSRDTTLRGIFAGLRTAAKEKCLKRKVAKAERELAKAKAEAESAAPEPARKRGKFAVEAPPQA